MLNQRILLYEFIRSEWSTLLNSYIFNIWLLGGAFCIGIGVQNQEFIELRGTHEYSVEPHFSMVTFIYLCIIFIWFLRRWNQFYLEKIASQEQ